MHTLSELGNLVHEKPNCLLFLLQRRQNRMLPPVSTGIASAGEGPSLTGDCWTATKLIKANIKKAMICRKQCWGICIKHFLTFVHNAKLLVHGKTICTFSVDCLVLMSSLSVNYLGELLDNKAIAPSPSVRSIFAQMLSRTWPAYLTPDEVMKISRCWGTERRHDCRLPSRKQWDIVVSEVQALDLSFESQAICQVTAE